MTRVKHSSAIIVRYRWVIPSANQYGSGFRYTQPFSVMGASKIGPCLEDCTINTYGFNLRQGQANLLALAEQT
jgi:hypothetical protein